MLISLSFSTTISFFVAATRLLSASKLVPFAIAESPTTATTCSAVPRASRAAASPAATDSATPAWPATAASARLSAGFGNGATPSSRRSVEKSFPPRSVRIFHAYAWWPTSHTMRSTSGSNASASAIAISTAPSDEARCPPFLSTASSIIPLISCGLIFS